jgi:hypothetical protein
MYVHLADVECARANIAPDITKYGSYTHVFAPRVEDHGEAHPASGQPGPPLAPSLSFSYAPDIVP